MKKKTIAALIMAAALLGATYLLSKGDIPSSEITYFVIIFGAISALFVGGRLRRKK